MRIKSLIATSAIVFVLGPAGAATPLPPIAPVGPWNVEFADKMCLLSRPYGKNGATTLILKPSMIGENLEIIGLAIPRPGKLF